MDCKHGDLVLCQPHTGHEMRLGQIADLEITSVGTLYYVVFLDSTYRSIYYTRRGIIVASPLIKALYGIE